MLGLSFRAWLQNDEYISHQRQQPYMSQQFSNSVVLYLIKNNTVYYYVFTMISYFYVQTTVLPSRLLVSEQNWCLRFQDFEIPVKFP